MQAYCMKCRTKREMKQPRMITLKNRRPATQGVCPVCGSKMFRIGGTRVGIAAHARATPPRGPDFKIPKRRRY